MATCWKRWCGRRKPPAPSDEARRSAALVGLLEFALLVCTASLEDCYALVEAAEPDDWAAFERLIEVARAGVLGLVLSAVDEASIRSRVREYLACQACLDTELKGRHSRRSRGGFSNDSAQKGFSDDSTQKGHLRPICGEAFQSQDESSVSFEQSPGHQEGRRTTLSFSAAGSRGAALEPIRIQVLEVSGEAGEAGEAGAGEDAQGLDASSWPHPSDNNPPDDAGAAWVVLRRASASFKSQASSQIKRGPRMNRANTLLGFLADKGDLGQDLSSRFESEAMESFAQSSNRNSQVIKVRFPGDFADTAGVDESCQSEAGATNCSAEDVTRIHPSLNTESTVRLDVLNLKDGAGPTKVDIEFQSQCVRTQHCWERQLVQQQKALLEAVSTKLEGAEQELRVVDHVRQEQKEVLRGFRRIITRERGVEQEHSCLDVYIVEEDDALRKELQQSCQLLEYECTVYASLAEVYEAFESQERDHDFPGSPRALDSPKSARRVTLRRRSSITSMASMGSVGSMAGDLLFEGRARLVFLGASCMNMELPDDWKDGRAFVVLTSEAEQIEDVGHKLLATGEAEIRERLRERSVSEYVMLPLTLEVIRDMAQKALIRHFGHDYLILQTVGRGLCGVVYRTKRLRDGELFALKEISTRRQSMTAKQDMERETSLLRELDWPTLVDLVDAWEGHQMRYLLMPLLDGGTLSNQLEAARTEGKRLATLVRQWYSQVLHALTYLHWSGVLHRDLKPQNLLLGADERLLQICDLGSAAMLPGPGPHPARRARTSGSPGAPLFAAPEALLGDNFHAASDMWSVGVIFYEMVTLKPLFPPEVQLEELQGLIDAFSLESSFMSRLVGEGAAKNVGKLASQALVEAAGRDRNGAEHQLTSEVRELLRKDLMKRPSAASLAVKTSNINTLREVLKETGVISNDPEDVDLHLSYFGDLVEQSEAAADLQPAEET